MVPLCGQRSTEAEIRPSPRTFKLQQVFIFPSLVQRPNVATGKSRQSEAQHSMNEWLRKNTFSRKKENRLASFLSHGLQ
ncbi:hypothetical protein OJAV_G00160820 [Oryzias javanicus]|uniref:Uncharacterized protein n=1 Tax=Oryzias javanicus TaxID=123683 RepID=A0A437CJ88_ORYJA|nr:hypothetical protein OJAV_G00160820 [Oryzias javanicus]